MNESQPIKESDVSPSSWYEIKELIDNIIPESNSVASDDELKNNDRVNLTKHNVEYTRLLKLYVDNYENASGAKRINREVIFRIAKVLLIAIPITMCIVIVTSFVLMIIGIDAVSLVTTVLTSMLTLLSTLFIMMKIITKYLFNKDEEKHLSEIISEIQQYDSKIRDDVSR